RVAARASFDENDELARLVAPISHIGLGRFHAGRHSRYDRPRHLDLWIASNQWAATGASPLGADFLMKKVRAMPRRNTKANWMKLSLKARISAWALILAESAWSAAACGSWTWPTKRAVMVCTWSRVLASQALTFSER